MQNYKLKILTRMNKYSIQSFIQETAQDETKNDFFQLESPCMLELNISNQTVMLKKGAMVAYTGNIKFEREGMFSKGIGNLLKKTVSGEGTTMMKTTGTGRVYAADCEKRVRILYLENESINVNGNDILAHEESVNSEPLENNDEISEASAVP